MADYFAVTTAYGQARIAQAEALGTIINLTHIALGDGGGNPVEPPTDQQTALVRERGERRAIARMYQNPNRPNQYAAEVAVPHESGGFVLRELGVYDDAGGLFVYANTPEVPFVEASSGAFADGYIRIFFEVSNAEVVNVVVDPNVALVSQTWVINNITAATIIPGGTVGQYLAKSSNADGACEWRDFSAVNVVVSSIEEPQTLAAGQTHVDLSYVTTSGLAVYVDGVRLSRGPGADGWEPNPSDEFASIILGQSYPAGTRILMAMNDPMGSVTEPLARSQNLSDVLDKPAARSSLDVFSRAETRQMAPPGKISEFAMDTAPAGWLKANGAEISRSAYPELFAAIGTRYGPGNSNTTFNLPDYRGIFRRGWDDGRGVDIGRLFGSEQDDMLRAHDHTATSASAGSHSHTMSGSTSISVNAARTNWVGSSDGTPLGSGTLFAGSASWTTSRSLSGSVSGSTTSGGSHTHRITVNESGGLETRPRNAAVLVCIKF